jgi:low temperature requirement protein LtrA
VGAEMASPPAWPEQRDVASPLELFYDLIDVFALSQLTHLLIELARLSPSSSAGRWRSAHRRAAWPR